jgi:hypothetical protein
MKEEESKRKSFKEDAADVVQIVDIKVNILGLCAVQLLLCSSFKVPLL